MGDVVPNEPVIGSKTGDVQVTSIVYQGTTCPSMYQGVYYGLDLDQFSGHLCVVLAPMVSSSSNYQIKP
jgi:hypothetical protein